MHQIQLANIDDLNSIYILYQSATNFLKQKGWAHWNNYYSKEKIETQIQKSELYKLTINKKIEGVVCISDICNNDYWDNKKALYPSGLAINPTKQNQGLGKEMLDFIKQYAIQNDFNRIRFDALGNWDKLTKMYTDWGAKIVGFVGDKNNLYGNLFEIKL